MLKATYASKEEVPEKFAELYTERDGQMVLTGVEGIKTQADVDAVKTTLTKVRKERDDFEKELKNFDGIDVEEIGTMRQELEELKLAGKDGKIDDEAINKIVESRLKMKIAPIERERDSLKVQLDEAVSERDSLTNEKRVNTITSSLQDKAAQMVRPEAVSDVLSRAGMFELSEDGKVLTKDGCDIGVGLNPEQFISEMLKTQKHWANPSNSGDNRNLGGKPIKDGENPTIKDLVEEVFK